MFYATSISKKLVYFPSLITPRTRRTSLKSDFGGLIFWLVPILAIIGLVLFYVYLTNNAVSMGYETKEYKKTVADLEQQNEFLEGELSRLRSIDNLEGIAIETLKMEKALSPSFLKIVPPEVALEK